MLKTTGVEVLGGTKLETKTIKQILTENPNITEPQKYEPYKDTLLTKAEQQQLIEGKLSLRKISTLPRERFKDEVEVTQNIDQAQQVSKQAEAEQNKSAKEAEKTATTALEQLKSGDTKQAVKKFKDSVKEAGDEVIEKQALEFVKKVPTMLFLLVTFQWGKLGDIFSSIFSPKKVAKEVAEGAKEITEEQIEKVTQQEIDAISTISTPVYEGIEKFIGVPLTPKEKEVLQKRLNPNEAGSYITAEQYRELMSKNGKLSLDDLKSLNLLAKIKQDPELVSLKEKILNHMQTKVFNQVRGYFSKIGVEFNAEKDNELKKIVSEEFSKTSVYKKGVEFQNTGTAKVDGIEIVGSPFEIGGMIGIIFLRAFGIGIIDIKHLAFGVANEGVDTLTIGLKGISGEEVLPEINASMSWDSFDEHISQMPPEKKVLLLRAFHGKLGLIVAVLGTVSGKLLDGTLTLVEGSKRIVQGKSFFTGPVERLQQTLEIIKPGEGKWLGEITKAVQQSKLSYEAVAALKLKDEAEIIQEARRITGQHITDISQAKNALTQTLSDSTKELTNLQSKVSLLSKNGKSLAETPVQSYFLRKNIDELAGIVKINQELGQGILNGNLGKYGSEIHKLVKSFNLRQIQGNIVMDIADIKSAKELGKALGRLSPEILKTFFKGVPIFVLGGAVFEASQEEEATTFEKVKKALCLTNGFYGAGMLLKESKFSIDENGFHMEKPGSFGAGIMLGGIETGFFSYTVLKNYKNIGLGRAIGKGIFETFFRIPIEAAKMLSWPLLNGSRFAQIVSKFPNFLKSTGKNTITKGSLQVKIAGLIALGLGTTAAYAMGESEIEKLLSDENNFNPDGSPKTEKIKETWGKLSKNEKKELLDTLLISKIGTIFEPFKNDIQTTFDETGNYNIIINEENTDLVKLKQQLSDLVEYDLIQFMSDVDSNGNVIIRTGSV